MPISIRLPDELEARLRDLAARTGRSKTSHATEAIADHIDDLEDLYLAEQRLIDIGSGKSTTVSMEDVMKRRDLEELNPVAAHDASRADRSVEPTEPQ